METLPSALGRSNSSSPAGDFNTILVVSMGTNQPDVKPLEMTLTSALTRSTSTSTAGDFTTIHSSSLWGPINLPSNFWMWHFHRNLAVQPSRLLQGTSLRYTRLYAKKSTCCRTSFDVTLLSYIIRWTSSFNAGDYIRPFYKNLLRILSCYRPL